MSWERSVTYVSGLDTPAADFLLPAARERGARDGWAGGHGPSGGDGCCRKYQTTARINGVMQPTHGTACLQPDGTWRIVN